MKIYDENMQELIEPDLELGSLTESTKPVIHRWIVDVEEVTHEEVIAEYPNGGKDVKIVVDVEEQGHWETVDENGEVVDFDGFIPDDMPKDQETPDTWQFYFYKPYTAEQLTEIEQQKQQAETKAAKAEEREAFISDGQAQLDEMAAAIEELATMLGGE